MISENIINRTVNPSWVSKYKSKLVSAEDAVKVISSGDKIVIHPGGAAPMHLIDKMVERKEELFGVELYHILVVGNLPYIEPGMENILSTRRFLSEETRARRLTKDARSLFPFFFPK